MAFFQAATKTWMPGIRLRQGFGGFGYQARRSFSEGGHKAGHDDVGEGSPYSLLSTFQKIGVAGPSSTPVIDLRQALGIVNCPSGT